MEQAGGHHAWGRVKYRFRGHAEEPFWAWVCSWARSMQKPSDLGFSDDRFNLPPLIEKSIVVRSVKARQGCLFTMPARDMQEEREDRRNTIEERTDKAAEVAMSNDGYSVIWCELNDEGDMLEKKISDSVQIKGSTSDSKKEELLSAFSNGEVKRLVLKPKIGAWGLNWQHCNNVVMLPSHSYERDYQAVRRCWRFGQTKPVTVTRIVSEGEEKILSNLERKASQSARMFQSIVAHMKDAMHLASQDFFPEQEELPKWL
jgi:hypothetical protein